MKRIAFYVFLSLGILVSSFMGGPMAHAKGDPIKIGLVTDLTGFLSVNGIYIRQAMIMALEEVNYTVAGRPIEFIVEDEAGSPAVAMDKIRKLVESDKVSLFLGPFHGGAVVALANYAAKVQIPQIVTWYSIPGEQMLKTHWTWVPFGSLEQMSVPAGAYAYDALGFRTASTLGIDYVAGRCFMRGCTDMFEEKGGEIIQEQWMPLGTKDVAPYLTSIKKADVFMPWFAGITNTVGMRQIREYGVKMPIVMGQAGWINNPVQQEEIGDYGLGMMASDAYVWSIDTPENKDFVERYKKRWGELPAGPSYGGYFNMQVALEAFRKTGGDTSPKALAQALDKTEMKGFFGDFYFGDARIGVGNYFVLKAVKKEGEEHPYQAEVLAKYQVRANKVGKKIKYEIIKAEMMK